MITLTDLFSVRTWNSLIEKPKFWRWATLRLDSENYQEIMRSLQTGQSRVNNVQQIRVCLQEEEDKNNNWVLNILEDLVTAVLDDDSQLKSLDIAGSGLSLVNWASLSPVLLAQFLVLMEEGNFYLVEKFHERAHVLWYELTVLSNEWTIYGLNEIHMESLITKIADSSVMNMKSLCIEACDYGGNITCNIPPEVVSRAVTKLKTFRVIFRVIDGLLTAAQISAVFTSLSVSEDHKLRYLYLQHNNLRSVPTDILVGGISGLEEVNLSETRLTSEQVTGIYRMVADRRCARLRKIYLGGIDLSSISEDLLERAELNQFVEIIDDDPDYFDYDEPDDWY